MSGIAPPPGYVLTEFLCDRSGSMMSMCGSQYDGANEFLQSQQQTIRGLGVPGSISFTTFDDTVETPLDHVDILTLPLPEPRISELLEPRGGTRLIDTMIERLQELQRNMRTCAQAGKAPRGVFAVLTDGQDNRSSHSAADFHRLLDEVRREFSDVTCLFLGANIDADSTAASFGIGAGSAMTIGADPSTARVAFSCMSAAAGRATRGGGGAAFGGFSGEEREISAPPASRFGGNSRASAAPAVSAQRGGQRPQMRPGYGGMFHRTSGRDGFARS